MQLMRILGRSLVDSFCHYVIPMTQDGGDFYIAETDADDKTGRLLDLGRLAAVELRLTEARRHLEAAVDQNPGTLGGRLLLAGVLADLGRSQAARDLVSALLVECFADGRVWFLAGQLSERCEEIARAIECYEAAQTRPGRSGCEAAERLAAIDLASGDYSSACERLQWLADARPEEFCVRMELAGALAAMGDHKAAIRAYEDAILLEPDNWEVHKDLAATLESEGRHSEALAEVRLVLDEQPYFADLHLRAARLSARLEDRDAALGHADSALEINPRYLEAVVFKGLLLMAMGESRAAVATFHRALEINDAYVVAYAGLALAQDRAGLGKESAETLELGQAIAPGSEAIYNRLAEAGLQAAMANRPAPVDGVERAEAGERFSLDELDDAGSPDDGAEDADPESGLCEQLERHRAAVERHPRYADLRYYYGLLLSSLGRPDEALEQYRAAIEINPHYTEALVRLALAYWQRERVDEARHALAKAAETPGRLLRDHYRFGILWSDRGMWPLVVESLSRRVAEGTAGPIGSAVAAATQNLGICESRSRDFLRSLRLADHRDGVVSQSVS
jgi:tetratricopeptide (TPR) repeat protein